MTWALNKPKTYRVDERSVYRERGEKGEQNHKRREGRVWREEANILVDIGQHLEEHQIRLHTEYCTSRGEHRALPQRHDRRYGCLEASKRWEGGSRRKGGKREVGDGRWRKQDLWPISRVYMDHRTIERERESPLACNILKTTAFEAFEASARALGRWPPQTISTLGSSSTWKQVDTWTWTQV